MSELIKVVIGIQARSTSKRFPSKVFEKLGTKTILNHVVDSCLDSARYLNRNTHANNVRARVALLIPKDDPIKMLFKPTRAFDPVTVLEGPEDDVLSRYMGLLPSHDPTLIVRITADCPLIPHFVITKHIMNAVMSDSDYESNVDERMRTVPDGWDCEVISRRLLEYTNEHAKEPSDREHVTAFIRRSPPAWIRQGATIGFLPLFGMFPKISIDTQEDLDRVRKIYSDLQAIYDRACSLFGKQNVHRF